MSIYHHPRIVTDGLVLHLDAANKKSYPGNGTVWYDLSKNKMIGTLNNSPSFSSDNGGYFTFSSTKYISVPNNTSLDIRDNITLEAWVYISSNVLYGGILNFGQENGEQYSLNTMNTQKFSFGTNWTPSSTWYLKSTSSTYTLNTWTYVAATLSGSTLIFYINGLLDSSQALGQSGLTYFSGTFLTIGVNHPGGDEYLNGRVSSARIYNKVLSAADVRQNFNATKSRYGL